MVGGDEYTRTASEYCKNETGTRDSPDPSQSQAGQERTRSTKPEAMVSERKKEGKGEVVHEAYVNARVRRAYHTCMYMNMDMG